MKLVKLTGYNGATTFIPVDNIIGFIEYPGNKWFNAFICTGPDGVDDGENGWYVAETVDEVRILLEAIE